MFCKLIFHFFMIFLVLSLSRASTFVSSIHREIIHHIYPLHKYSISMCVEKEFNSVLFFTGGGEKSEPDDVEFEFQFQWNLDNIWRASGRLWWLD
jgi:hypothetical protein